MSRLFIYDENMTDERAKMTVAKFAAMAELSTPDAVYMKATAAKQITVAADVVIGVGSAIFKTIQTIIGIGNLDAGTDFDMGADYNIFICNPGSDAQDEVYLISKNTTFPTGYTASTSRRIGGFHYGNIRGTTGNYVPVNSSSAAWGSSWASNVTTGIIPNSVWTLRHRPKCNPAGMVYLGNSLWGDIYLSSTDGGDGFQSVYNGTPYTGTEGLNWYRATERAAVSGKRLPSYAEFCVGAYGSPSGLDASNTNGHTATTNTVRATVGKIVNATSARNVKDLVGNVWKWLDELMHDPTAASPAWHDVLADANYTCGQAYMYSNTGLHALIGGGDWNDGVCCGSRAVSCTVYPWYVSTSIGVWCVCDSL